jgi:hypothetical protein
MVFGLEGYSFELPKAERAPTFACPAIYKYEDLPTNVEQRALSNRDEWIRRNFGAVTETFSKIVVTASDLSSLLRIVETDLSLVHASYYTDDECIERIASWIAGKATLRALSELTFPCRRTSLLFGSLGVKQWTALPKQRNAA